MTLVTDRLPSWLIEGFRIDNWIDPVLVEFMKLDVGLSCSMTSLATDFELAKRLFLVQIRIGTLRFDYPCMAKHTIRGGLAIETSWIVNAISRIQSPAIGFAKPV
jgi:hypothetical protein